MRRRYKTAVLDLHFNLIKLIIWYRNFSFLRLLGIWVSHVVIDLWKLAGLVWILLKGVYVLQVVDIKGYKGSFCEWFEDSKEGLDDATEGNKDGVDIGAPCKFEGENEHKGSENVCEGLKQMESHFSSVDNQIS